MSEPDSPVSETVVIVCDTCRWSDEERVRDGRSAGEVFSEYVEIAGAAAGLRVVRHSCLMNCSRHCSASVTADGKTSYVLGDFQPSAEAADALTAYAALHAESDTGVVAYRQWPQGVKGKFVARVPALSALAGEPD